MYEFVVPGKPVAKGRPRFTRAGGGRAFTPAKTVNYEALVAICAQQAGVRPLSGPVFLSVLAVWKCPESEHQKRKPAVERWKDTGADSDNVLKIVGDALNGIAYADDRQVVRAVVEKRIAAQGLTPYLRVRVWAVDTLPE